MTSTIRRRRKSVIPPLYAAEAPNKEPIPPPINTPINARLKSICAAYNTLESTSKP